MCRVWLYSIDVKCTGHAAQIQAYLLPIGSKEVLSYHVTALVEHPASAPRPNRCTIMPPVTMLDCRLLEIQAGKSSNAF